MLLAPTGTGKTLAFLLPLVEMLKPENHQVQALIIVPSRELALQIEQVFKAMKTSFKVSCVYGGHPFKIEQNSMVDPPAVIIGTPGRLSDHLKRDSFDPKDIEIVVLDEFDKALQLGFHAQLRSIFEALTGNQRHLMTSATKLHKLPDFLPFSHPEVLNFLQDEKESKLELMLVNTSSKEKAHILMRLVAEFDQEACLVFCNHREAVDRISLLLNEHGIAHGLLHGGMEQIDREKNLIKFRGGATNLLIATDLASRGLDIPEIRHVVHYQLPPKKEAFIHRNGRTARMHADGIAYLILAQDEILPEYIPEELPEKEVSESLKVSAPPLYDNVYISAGKKAKISKGDIVGFLTQKGGLQNEDIGLITILDFASYVSIKKPVFEKVLSKLQGEKIKKTKVKIELAS